MIKILICLGVGFSLLCTFALCKAAGEADDFMETRNKE